MSYSNEDKALMLECLIECEFHKVNSCELFRKKTGQTFSRATLYNWLETDEFKTQFEQVLKEELDEAENSHKLLRKGLPIKDEDGNIIAWQEKPDRQAIEFFLKSKGKNRGWVEETNTNVNITKVTGITFDE